MIKTIYDLCHFLIRYSGIASFVRSHLVKNKVTIVLYHNPKREVFKIHLKYLTQKYNLISLTDFADAVYFKDQVNIPPHAMVITFDDGWKENYELLPIIRKYRIRPAIFLTAHLVNTERHFWWTACSLNDAERLKNLPNKRRLEELKGRYQYDPDKEYPGERQALSISEIREMKDYVDFGLHTCCHPILTKCSDEERRKEIIESKLELENLLGASINHFAYPDGAYDSDCIQILKECGLKTARTTDAGWNDKSSDPYKLKITGVSDNSSVTKLIAELTGIPLFFQYLIYKGSFKGLKNKINDEKDYKSAPGHAAFPAGGWNGIGN